MDDSLPDEWAAVNSGDRFVDDENNSLRVLESEMGVTRVEYRLPTETLIEKFDRASEPLTELLLVEKLREVDMEFPELHKEGFPYESPVPDETVAHFDVIETFDYDFDDTINLWLIGNHIVESIVQVFESDDVAFEPEQFPGIVMRLWEMDGAGFVVLFEDGTGASFAESESVADEQIESLTSILEDLDLL